MTGARHWWWHRPFLYVGRMAEDKGVTTIINAWKVLNTYHPKHCPPLWLVGGTPEEIERIRAAAGFIGAIDSFERLGQIQWWGYLDPPGLSALLTRVCVLLMHSRYEPGGRVVIEAMAQGVPVIATPYGFAKDLIRNWYNGFLVDFGDEETLVHRMAHFIQQPLLRNSLGATAQETAHMALSQWRFLETHCRVYDQAAGQLPLPTPKNEVESNQKTQDYFRRHRIIPTYPHACREPENQTVREFTEHHTGCKINIVQRIEDGPGSSTRWLLTWDHGRWIVKWPYPRLSLRALWDPLNRDELLVPAEDRFAREVFSGTLPCFLPWTANDPSKLLLLRPVYPQQQAIIDHELFIELSNRYRELYQYPLPSFSWEKDLERDWSTATAEEIAELRKIIREELKKTSWHPSAHVSIRLAWREALLALEIADGPLKQYIPKCYLNYINAFCSLAEAEAGLGLCASHGSGDLTHCLRAPSGLLMFIDGEHVHPAQPGEDMAATLFYAIADAGQTANEKQLWPELLEAVAADCDEKNILLAWAGLLAWQDLRKQAAMLRRSRHTSMARWETLGGFALEQLSQ